MTHWHFRYGYYRILIAKTSSVKYLALPDPGPSGFDLGGDQLNFTTVPDGNWNIGYLVPQPGTNRYALGSMERTDLAEISPTWHPHKVDYLALNEPRDEVTGFELQSTGLHYGAFNNHFGCEKVVVSYEWIPDTVYGVNHETQIYALIDGYQIAPRFLAHVTEKSGDGDGNGERVIGLMVEYVIGARAASIEDLAICKQVLARLHARGIAHSCPRPRSFLIKDNANGPGTASTALLQSFSGAYQTSDQSILDSEMESVESLFQQAAAEEPEKLFSLSREVWDQIRAICSRDGGLHPRVQEQAQKEGKITITEEEHRQMLAELQSEWVALRQSSGISSWSGGWR
jgi:hypothetical protein